jgi:benzoyl-CoA reductase/2-hydroxyglutaryl-CoA dehydratase subunit BcrC/BadD/HgdB
MLLRKKVPHFGIIEDPLDILVEQYLFNVPAPCMGNTPRRLNYILKTVRDFNVHGIIHYNRIDTCNTASEQAKTIKDRIYNTLLVPTLILEAKPAGGTATVKDRVKSFIDIIGGRI